MSSAAQTTSHPPPAAWRWAVLIAISVAMFGNYYAYDSIGPVADSLQRDLGFSDTQIGTLNAIYSIPNIVMVLIGGIIVDRIGTRRATVMFAGICLAGAILTAATGSFTVMATGNHFWVDGVIGSAFAAGPAAVMLFRPRNEAPPPERAIPRPTPSGSHRMGTPGR